MAYRAAASDTILLKLIHLRDLETPQQAIALESLAEELADLQGKNENICVYATTAKPESMMASIRHDLLFLQGMGLVRCDFSNPHVKLTELGRFFAGALELPTNVSRALCERPSRETTASRAMGERLSRETTVR